MPVQQDYGLSDYDLPFVMMYDESKRKVVLRREDYPEAHLDCFDEFTPEETVAFEKWQWSVLDEEHFQYLKSASPVSRRETWHYSFRANDHIPLVRPRLSNSALLKAMIGKDTSRAGSNGEVFLWALSDPTRSRLMSDNTEYWESNEIYLQNETPMDYSRVLWVAEQCEGLADALRYIHRFVSADENAQVISYHHGNIKPENILLYFRPHQRPVLQLSDFRNSTDTTDCDPAGDRPSTNAHHGAGDYTAPEVYFGEPVSSSSDVWSLCCVFLDFIEWLMPSQSAPSQPKRVLTDLEDSWRYVQGREAFVDWRRSRVESGQEDVAAYFFDTSTGELSLWIDTVSRPIERTPACHPY
ncbi:hypothetical protein N0V82_003790 [Gnomoniopsis sp. IMI 355080]|nr:hypothetical protein N0V82_003790 [Gnomoniopsis sp. IMI 355080]